MEVEFYPPELQMGNVPADLESVMEDFRRHEKDLAEKVKYHSS